MIEFVRTGLTRLFGRLALGIALASGSAAVWGQPRFSFSTDGTVVTDARTGLVWRRCSAGQILTGTTCNGTAAAYNPKQALYYASTQSGWRLPNVKELSSIIDRDRFNPSIDSVAFPGTPSGWYWTSSPLPGYPRYAWSVNFNHGMVYGYHFDPLTFHVRLVR